jgi:formylglycine-generating enzyme
MSGSVAEWEDSCDAGDGADDKCLVRGGSFSSTAEQLMCASSELQTRDFTSDTLGFRCCL